MKVSGFCALFLMVVTTFSLFSFISTTRPSWFSDLVSSRCGDKTTPNALSRKLKETVHTIKNNEKVDIGDQVTLDDYNPVNPSPSVSKHVHPAPIQHGAPLMPFIPIPPPPGSPKPGQDDYD